MSHRAKTLDTLATLEAMLDGKHIETIRHYMDIATAGHDLEKQMAAVELTIEFTENIVESYSIERLASLLSTLSTHYAIYKTLEGDGRRPSEN